MTDLAAQLEALGAARVLVVGDVMLDRFVAGAVERISPEGPIPVLRVEQENAMLGGAGNVQRNLAALGLETDLIAAVGDDPAGREVANLLGDQAQGLFTVPGRATTIKERFLAGGQQLLRVDRETARDLPEETAGELIERVTARLPEIGALVLSDYGKGVLSGAVLSALIRQARAAGLPVIVDPKGSDYACYRGASLVTPNLKELSAASRRPVGDDASVVEACRALIADCGLGGILATRSEKGMSLVLAEAEPLHLRAEAQEVYDVSGAGDTVVAMLGAALAAGLAPQDAAQLANLAAGIVVAKVGTATVSLEELRHGLYAAELHAAEAKVSALEPLVEQVARWRRRGLKVGFTNGCFDLLHPGHLSLLRQARAQCDRLVVGLNSDASVRRLKGERRPIQGEAARAAVLASLATVDRVVIFAEDTPLNLIEALKPEVLVKGADYTVEQVVGHELVASYGGRVVLAELEPGQSTSRTIERM
ncbi:MAG: D-glycero-beta-D-manno-heptose-7-phosphate kinase [Pseudomonadota bacterium]